MKSTALISFVFAVILIILSSRASAYDGCFPHGYAYLKRLTVIREKPGLYGRAISASWSQDGFPVTNSLPVRGDCWAKTQDGWMLADNLTAEPIPVPDPSSLTPVRPLIIEGDTDFVAQILMGRSYLREEAPHWYRYVKRYRYTVEPCGPCEPGRSKARWPDKRVFIHEDTFVSPMRLASVLVHEACHIHQGYEDRWPTIDDGCYAYVRVEQECVSRELEMVVDIDLEHGFVVEHGKTIAELFEWWATNAVSSLVCGAGTV